MTRALQAMRMTALLILGLAGCSAPAVLRLQPVDEPTRWLHGRQVVTHREHGVEMVFSFQSSTARHLVFDLEVWNGSKSAFDVVPQASSYSSPQQGPTVRADDPESEILELDVALSKTEQSAENEAGVHALLNLLDVVTPASTEEDAEIEEAQYIEREVEHQATQARLADRMVDLSQARDVWRDEALRRTTLQPGEGVRGLVFFPRHDVGDRAQFTFVAGIAVARVVYAVTQHR